MPGRGSEDVTVSQLTSDEEEAAALVITNSTSGRPYRVNDLGLAVEEGAAGPFEVEPPLPTEYSCMSRSSFGGPVARQVRCSVSGANLELELPEGIKSQILGDHVGRIIYHGLDANIVKMLRAHDNVPVRRPADVVVGAFVQDMNEIHAGSGAAPSTSEVNQVFTSGTPAGVKFFFAFFCFLGVPEKQSQC